MLNNLNNNFIFKIITIKNISVILSVEFMMHLLHSNFQIFLLH